MTQAIQLVPATQFSVEMLADLFTRSFEAYFYPGTTTATSLSQRIRQESIDLWRSVVLLVDEQPAGIALLALRGEQAWCGGFGITMPFRGQGLSHRLIEALIEQARAAGARNFSLEVLVRNTVAFRTYTRAGLQTRRDLVLLEWRKPDDYTPTATNEVSVAAPETLLAHYAGFHPVPAAWQRALPALLVSGGLQGLALEQNGALAGYILFQGATSERLRIADLGARSAEAAATLLQALQQRAASILCINEPSNSPFLPAFIETGFSEIDRQHDLELVIAPG